MTHSEKLIAQAVVALAERLCRQRNCNAEQRVPGKKWVDLRCQP